MSASSQFGLGIARLAWAALGVASCLGCGEAAVRRGSPAELRVVRGPFAQRQLLTGVIEAVESAQVKVPRTRENRLQIQWLAADGSRVSAGDRVLEFDNSSFTADLDQQRSAVQRSRRSLLQVTAQGDARLREAEAAVERARIALAKAELDASVAGSVRSRYEQRSAELARAKAQADYEKSLADLRSTGTSVEADIRVSEEQHLRSRRELTLAEEAVRELVLSAPREGIVVVEENPWEDRKFQVGDTVFAGWTVVGIPDLEDLRVRASLSDVDDGSLARGMAARCTPDIEPELHLPGRITEITPIAREQRVFSQRRGFDVVVELERAWGDTLLLPGMSVRVEVEAGGGEAVLVPRAALDLSVSPARARRRDGSWAEVELGDCSASACVLVDGLAEGDRLARIGDQAS